MSALQSAAVDRAGPLLEKFATSSGRVLGWFGVALGVVMVVAEPITADSANSVVILVGVALACLSWVTLVRPRASAHERGLLMQNMLRDVTIPWSSIERCRVGQTLVVSTKEAETFHGLGVTRSARAQMREQYGTSSILFNFGSRRGHKLNTEGGPSMARGEFVGGTYTSYVESRVAGLASSGERGSGQGQDAAPVVAWAPLPLLLLGVAVVCAALLFVA